MTVVYCNSQLHDIDTVQEIADRVLAEEARLIMLDMEPEQLHELEYFHNYPMNDPFFWA